MRTEVILAGFEEMEEKRRIRQRRRLLRRILREILRGSAMLIGSAVAVFLIVPISELLMQNFGSRLVIELAACYLAILWLGEKLYRRRK